MTTVGPYELVRPLGTGGMGEVFLGRDIRLHRLVALKRVIAAADARALVLREARAAARLTHPNIAAVYDVVDLPDAAFIVMEYVDGESLAARIARGPLSPDEAVAIGRQLASAVAAAHAQGVVHRDLKPSNIQLTPGGTAKVLDFGVAKIAPLNTSATTTDVGHLPTTPATVAGNPGTPAYMAPEQLAGRGADERSDVYGLGAILYEMTTGVRPYRGRDVLSLLDEVAAGEPKPAHELNPAVPRWLSDVIAYALKRQPAERIPSARALEEALTARRPPTLTAIEPQALRRRIRGAPAIAAAALLVVASLAVPVIRRAITQATNQPSRRIVAVLPLENLSGDRRKDYLGAGVAETLTVALSKIPALTVLSRSEVQDVLKRETEARKIARDLDVALLVGGSVQQSADRVRVTLRMVHRDGTVAWSDAYEGATSDLFALQRTMSSDLVERVQGHPAAIDLTIPSTKNVDALTAYWQGRSILDRAVSRPDFANAAASFRRAIDLDPQFALGYAGLADTLWQEYQVTHDAALPRAALDAGMTALRLDPNQPATRVAVATVYQGLGEYDEAADQLHRALELQPSNDDAHRILARVLTIQDKPEQAIEELQQAIALHPRHWGNFNELGRLYFQLRRLPEAADTYQKALEIAPNDPRTYLSLGNVYMYMRQWDRALAMLKRSNDITPTGIALSNMGTTYYRLGRMDDAVAAFTSALRLDPKSLLLHGNLGDAYRRLDRLADARREYEAARSLAADALSVNEKDARTLSRMAVYEAKLGMSRDAESHAAQAAALAPKDPDVVYKRAVVWALAGRRDDALKALEQAIALGINPADAREDDDLDALKTLERFHAIVGGNTKETT